MLGCDSKAKARDIEPHLFLWSCANTVHRVQCAIWEKKGETTLGWGGLGVQAVRSTTGQVCGGGDAITERSLWGWVLARRPGLDPEGILSLSWTFSLPLESAYGTE